MNKQITIEEFLQQHPTMIGDLMIASTYLTKRPIVAISLIRYAQELHEIDLANGFGPFRIKADIERPEETPSLPKPTRKPRKKAAAKAPKQEDINPKAVKNDRRVDIVPIDVDGNETGAWIECEDADAAAHKIGCHEKSVFYALRNSGIVKDTWKVKWHVAR